MPNRSQFVSHPIRVAAIMFVSMTLLCAACALFVPEGNILLFIGIGSVYCLILALFVVGLTLAFPGCAIQWWFRLGFVPLLSILGYWLLLMYSTELLVQMLTNISRAVLAVLGTWLTAGLVIAGAGWVKYFRGMLVQTDKQESMSVQDVDQL